MPVPPVLPEDFKGVIPAANSNLCTKMLLALIKFPTQFYQFYKWMVNDDGTATTDFIAWVGLQAGTTPGVPTGVKATDGTYTDHVRVTWSPLTGASSYQIWRGSTSDPGSAIMVGTEPASPFDDASNNFQVDTHYYYFVRAVIGSTTTGYSDPDTGFADSSNQGGAGAQGNDAGDGTNLWTVPGAVTTLEVELWACGGGGGELTSSGWVVAGGAIATGGAGGGAGEYIHMKNIQVSPGDQLQFFIGPLAGSGQKGGDAMVIRVKDNAILAHAVGGGPGANGWYGAARTAQGGIGGTGGDGVGVMYSQVAGGPGDPGVVGYEPQYATGGKPMLTSAKGGEQPTPTEKNLVRGGGGFGSGVVAGPGGAGMGGHWHKIWPSSA